MSKKLTNTKEVIAELKAVREEKGLSFGDILSLMEKNGDYLSKSTLSRVFAEGSEKNFFKYDETIRPIAKALLDIENIEDTDDMDVKAMKTLLKYKMQRIEELEARLKDSEAARNKEIREAYEKFDAERNLLQETIVLLNKQIDLKDKRIDFLNEQNQDKDKYNRKLMDKILECRDCNKGDI